MSKTLWGLIAAVVSILLQQASPVIKEQMRNLYNRLRESAAKTENPVDDLLVQSIGALLGLGE